MADEVVEQDSEIVQAETTQPAGSSQAAPSTPEAPPADEYVEEDEFFADEEPEWVKALGRYNGSDRPRIRKSLLSNPELIEAVHAVRAAAKKKLGTLSEREELLGRQAIDLQTQTRAFQRQRQEFYAQFRNLGMNKTDAKAAANDAAKAATGTGGGGTPGEPGKGTGGGDVDALVQAAIQKHFEQFGKTMTERAEALEREQQEAADAEARAKRIEEVKAFRAANPRFTGEVQKRVIAAMNADKEKGWNPRPFEHYYRDIIAEDDKNTAAQARNGAAKALSDGGGKAPAQKGDFRIDMSNAELAEIAADPERQAKYEKWLEAERWRRERGIKTR